MKSKVDPAFGQNLKRIRLKLGLSRYQMAELLDMTERNWYRLEAGMRPLTKAESFYLKTVLKWWNESQAEQKRAKPKAKLDPVPVQIPVFRGVNDLDDI